MRVALCTSLLLLSTTSVATDQVRGEVTRYTSPNGVAEQCVAIAHMPGGVYSADDRATEQCSCRIDFYSPNTGLCPKTWSTSPGAMVFELAGGH